MYYAVMVIQIPPLILELKVPDLICEVTLQGWQHAIHQLGGGNHVQVVCAVFWCFQFICPHMH